MDFLENKLEDQKSWSKSKLTEERKKKMETIKSNIKAGIPICCTCGRVDEKTHALSYKWPVFEQNGVVEVDLKTILDSFGFYSKESNSNGVSPPHVCHFCFHSIKLLAEFQSKKAHQIRKAQMIKNTKVFETVCYCCFKLLLEGKKTIYFGSKIFERSDKEEYLLARFLRDLCKSCNVEIFPKDIEIAYCCHQCHYHLSELRNFKKITSSLEEVASAIPKEVPTSTVVRDPRLRNMKSAFLKTTGWRTPKKITFSSVERIQYSGHVSNGLKEAIALHRVPSHQKSQAATPDSPISQSETRSKLSWSPEEINDLLDCLEKHFVGSFLRWPLIMKDMLQKGYNKSLTQYQQQWYKLKSQAHVLSDDSTTPVLERVHKLIQHFTKLPDEPGEDNLSEKQANTREEPVVPDTQRSESNLDETMMEIEALLQGELEELPEMPSKVESKVETPEELKSRKFEVTREVIVEGIEREQMIQFYKRKLMELEGDKESNSKESLFLSIEEAEKIFGVNISDYKFNRCLKRQIIKNEEPFVIEDSDDEDVMIVE